MKTVVWGNWKEVFQTFFMSFWLAAAKTAARPAMGEKVGFR